MDLVGAEVEAGQRQGRSGSLPHPWACCVCLSALETHACWLSYNQRGDRPSTELPDGGSVGRRSGGAHGDKLKCPESHLLLSSQEEKAGFP